MIRGWLVVALAVAGCSGDGEDVCKTSTELCALEHAFEPVQLAPGEEVDLICQSWTLDNPEELWLGKVHIENDGGYHHSNWFYVPDDNYEVPDGNWDCDENNASELIAAILGGYMVAQSTQVQSEDQVLPAGAAIRVPPYSRVIGFTHLLNATDQPIQTQIRMRLESKPETDVAVRMTPARIEYRDLHIAPMARSEFTTECDLKAEYETVMGAPWKFVLYYLLPHYHELGIYAQMEIAGGPRDGEVIFRHDGYGEAFGRAIDPPIDLAAAGATGLRYTCGFLNPRSEEVIWGQGDQEMCVTAIFADTDMAFEGDVGQGTGSVTGTAADGTITNAGPCSLLGIPWDHDKEGGPPR